jgi:hypothetical protein
MLRQMMVGWMFSIFGWVLFFSAPKQT